MDVKEIPIIIVLAVNLLVGISGIADRKGGSSKQMGLLAISVAGWCAAFLWQRWNGHGVLPTAFGGICIVSGPFWISWAVSKNIKLKSFPKLLAGLVVVYLFSLPLVKYIKMPTSGFALLIGYAALALALGSVSKRGEADAKTISHELLKALALPFGIAGIFSVVSFFHTPLLRDYMHGGAVVATQLVIIFALRSGWLRQEKLLSSGLVWFAYALVATGVLLIPLTVVTWLLDAEPPLWALLSLVSVAILSAAIFPILGPRMAALLENALFPDATKIRREVESLRRDLEDVRGRLRRAERLRIVGEIAAQVAHEIKNPLGPIKGYAKLLIEDANAKNIDVKSAKKGLKIIAEEAEKIDERVSRLLGFARETNATKAASNLNNACKRAVLLLEASDETKPECRIELNLDAGETEIIADSNAIEEAVYNLLLNAAQATGGAGHITLKTRLEKENSQQCFLIEIADNGPGYSCDPEELFKPFYTTKEGGTGLGLGIVRNIIKSHSGTVSASQNKNGGAKFTIKGSSLNNIYLLPFFVLLFVLLFRGLIV